MCKFHGHAVIGDEPTVGAHSFLKDMMQRIAVMGKMIDDLDRFLRGSAHLFKALVHAEIVVNAHVTAAVIDGNIDIGAIEADTVEAELRLFDVLEDLVEEIARIVRVEERGVRTLDDVGLLT